MFLHLTIFVLFRFSKLSLVILRYLPRFLENLWRCLRAVSVVRLWLPEKVNRFCIFVVCTFIALSRWYASCQYHTKPFSLQYSKLFHLSYYSAFPIETYFRNIQLNLHSSLFGLYKNLPFRDKVSFFKLLPFHQLLHRLTKFGSLSLCLFLILPESAEQFVAHVADNASEMALKNRQDFEFLRLQNHGSILSFEEVLLFCEEPFNDRINILDDADDVKRRRDVL